MSKCFRALTVFSLLGLTQIACACSMFTLTSDGVVLFANNEDFTKPGVIWFVTASPGKYGRVNVGFDDDFAQGSMNERGLCFDAAVVAEVPWTPDPAKKPIDNLFELIMDTCGTVEEALALFEEYQCRHLASAQFMFADATGACAVVTSDPRGGISIVRKESNHLLITGDRLAYCGFRAPSFMLGERALKTTQAATPEQCAEVLDVLHQTGKEVFTTYSNVFDLTNKRIHVWNLADYTERREFDLQEELAKGAHTLKLRTLFNDGPTIDELRDAPRRIYATEIQLPAETLAKYAGKYVVEVQNAEITILVDGADGLIYETANKKQVRLFAESETVFRFRDVEGQLSFQTDATGAVTGLTLHRNGDGPAKRVSS